MKDIKIIKAKYVFPGDTKLYETVEEVVKAFPGRADEVKLRKVFSKDTTVGVVKADGSLVTDWTSVHVNEEYKLR